MCAVDVSGSLYCWGQPWFIPGGNVRFVVPTRISGFAGVQQLRMADLALCAQLTGSDWYCIGDLQDSFRGYGVQHSATRIGVLAGALDVSLRWSGGCFVRGTDGVVRCFGDNEYGAAGRPPSSIGLHPTGPVDVPGISGVIAVTSGGWHSCALRADGAVFCWGRNTHGQVGVGPDPRNPADGPGDDPRFGRPATRVEFRP